MGFLTREQILHSNPRSYKDVRAPELGGTIRVQSLTGKEFEDYQATNRGKPDKNGNVPTIFAGSVARLLVRCIVDQEGKRIFGDDDAPALAEANAAALNRLFRAACKLNGIGESEMEEMVKNSEPAQNSDEPFS